jgi:hypothetical protein
LLRVEQQKANLAPKALPVNMEGEVLANQEHLVEIRAILLEEYMAQEATMAKPVVRLVLGTWALPAASELMETVTAKWILGYCHPRHRVAGVVTR